MGTIIHRNTSYEPLKTFLYDDAICAGEQERQKVNKEKNSKK